MFSRKTEIEKTDLLGARLVGCATETSRSIAEYVIKSYGIGFRDASEAPHFIIEVVVFYMHLVNRAAFAHFGAAKCAVFVDRLQATVLKEFLQAMSRDLSADALGDALRDTYNHREFQYAEYKYLMAEKDQPLENTLFWEFSKILFDFFNDHNPITLVYINLHVANLTITMMENAMKVGKVLQS